MDSQFQSAVQEEQELFLTDDEAVEWHQEDAQFENGQKNLEDSFPTSNSKTQRALFLLKCREVHKMSQQALYDIITDVLELKDSMIDELQQKIQRVLLVNNISPHDVIGLADIFKNEKLRDPLHDLQTEYLQNKHYFDEMGLVEPVEIVLKRKFVRKRLGHRSRITSLKSLEQFLQNKYVYDEIYNSHQRSDDYLEDFCDGGIYKTHPLYTLHPNALEVILYYDDVEICNPIGSKAKVHKLGIFYYILGNIKPCYRSSIKNIQLVCVLKVSTLQKHGVNVVLQPFMHDIKELEKSSGVTFIIGDHERVFRGTITVCTADNLASQLIGGYKSLASALRKCRFCMAVESDMSSKFQSSDFPSRNKLMLFIYNNLMDLYMITWQLHMVFILNLF